MSFVVSAPKCEIPSLALMNAGFMSVVQVDFKHYMHGTQLGMLSLTQLTIKTNVVIINEKALV